MNYKSEFLNYLKTLNIKNLKYCYYYINRYNYCDLNNFIEREDTQLSFYCDGVFYSIIFQNNEINYKWEKNYKNDKLISNYTVYRRKYKLKNIKNE